MRHSGSRFLKSQLKQKATNEDEWFVIDRGGAIISRNRHANIGRFERNPAPLGGQGPGRVAEVGSGAGIAVPHGPRKRHGQSPSTFRSAYFAALLRDRDGPRGTVPGGSRTPPRDLHQRKQNSQSAVAPRRRNHVWSGQLVRTNYRIGR